MTLQRADDQTSLDTGESEQLLPAQETDPDTPSRRRRLSRRARWILVAALVLLLAGGGFGAWALFFRTPAATTTYRTTTVSSDTLKQTVSATGTLEPATESDLSFSSSGTVASVSVSAGDVVKKGQELATIDDSELKIDYDSAKASLTEAKEALSTLEDDDSSTATAISAAKATVQVKKNTKTEARTALKEATMVSPISGKVADVAIAAGDTVAGSSSTTSSASSSSSSGSSGSSSSGGTGTSTGSTTSTSTSSAAITVISDGTFTVTTSVSNADVGSIKKGLQATITPTGSTEAVYGTVSSVGVVASSSSSSSSSSGSSTFPVTVAVTGTHTSLLAGSSATVAITVKQLTGVLSVPTQAVTTVNGKTVVQKLVNGKQVQTEVKVGTSLGTSTVITSGIAAGDQVVLASFRASTGTGTGTGRTGQTGTTGQGGYSGQGGFPGQNGGVPGQAPGTGTGNR